MSFAAAAVSGGIAMLPSLFKGISAISQKNKANKINPVNPNYTMNSGVIDNARVLSERAGNYQMPGYGTAVGNINATAGQSFTNGSQGASSGGDILDLATKISYGQNRRLNDLAVTNAQGADQALIQSLNANAQAGQEYQNKNAYDRDIYQQQLREKAGLTQASNENAYGALDTGASVFNSLLNPMSMNTNKGLTPEQWAAYSRSSNRGV